MSAAKKPIRKKGFAKGPLEAVKTQKFSFFFFSFDLKYLPKLQFCYTGSLSGRYHYFIKTVVCQLLINTHTRVKLVFPRNMYKPETEQSDVSKNSVMLFRTNRF